MQTPRELPIKEEVFLLDGRPRFQNLRKALFARPSSRTSLDRAAVRAAKCRASEIHANSLSGRTEFAFECDVLPFENPIHDVSKFPA